MFKHILFILDYYLPHKGGSETVFEAIITRLLAKGYTITILTSHFDPKLPKHESKDELHIHRVGKSRFRFMLLAFRKGIPLLRKQPDIALIHTSTYGGALPASLLGILFRKKVILTVHEIFGRLRGKYKGRYIGRVYRVFESIIFMFPYSMYHCVSRYTMNSLRLYYGIPDRKIKMIYNGVDTTFRNPEEVAHEEIKNCRKTNNRANRFVVLYYGHAGKSKGIDYLVKALPEMVSMDPHMLFVFNLIDSKRTEHIKTKIKNLNLHACVEILNGLDKSDLRVLLASVDMVVAPSLSEGFGSVHTETVAMHKPLLTTYIASIPEVVRGNVKMIPPASTREIIQSILYHQDWI